MTETGSVRHEATTIDYTVIRSARRRKTIALRVDASGEVLVLAPSAASQRQLRDLVSGSAAWITQRLGAVRANLPRPPLLARSSVPYLGQDVPLEVDQSGVPSVQVALIDGAVRVRVPEAFAAGEGDAAVRQAFERWYRARAAEHIGVAVDRWSAIVGRAPARVYIRDQHRRWGSCAADATLRFNWRIVMDEPAVIDYVVVHELSHLKQRNHSGAFWAEVSAVMPDFGARRARLQEIGARLAL
jgi:predicted metal-dependent hydrolase